MIEKIYNFKILKRIGYVNVETDPSLQYMCKMAESAFICQPGLKQFKMISKHNSCNTTNKPLRTFTVYMACKTTIYNFKQQHWSSQCLGIMKNKNGALMVIKAVAC